MIIYYSRMQGSSVHVKYSHGLIVIKRILSISWNWAGLAFLFLALFMLPRFANAELSLDWMTIVDQTPFVSSADATHMGSNWAIVGRVKDGVQSTYSDGFVQFLGEGGQVEAYRRHVLGHGSMYNKCCALGESLLVVCGNYDPFDDPSRFGILACIDQQGDTIWTRRLDFGDIRDATALASYHDSLILVAGPKLAQGEIGQSAYLACFTSTGDVLWTRDFGVAWRQITKCNVVTPLQDDSIVLAGSVKRLSDPEPRETTWILCVSVEGDTIWYNEDIHGSTPAAIQSMSIGEPSGLCFGGVTNIDGQLRPLIIETDSQGDTVWSEIYEAGTMGPALSSVCNSSDNYILGSSHVESAGSYCQLWLVDSTGDAIWSESVHDDAADLLLTKVLCTGSDSLMILGDQVEDWPIGNISCFLAKFSISSDAEHPPDPCTAETSSRITALWPNPVRDMVAVSIVVPRVEPLRIHIIDILGRSLVNVHVPSTSSGIHNYNINTSSFPAGTYFVMLESYSTTSSVRFVVLR